ncbi:Bug family tripartite tricarboxylate transporter substrate binding protein [Cupriavidus basilensis]|uniref:Bug family tripartite tricarboxylate transporter substrate binding protein n=1 Tax=Cupriavidus basilensis TaxID=68895 RepID=UPI0009DA0BEA|nr:tripartite tricarboxylate transporter substrate binding protein [Cupriavidus basilensis]
MPRNPAFAIARPHFSLCASGARRKALATVVTLAAASLAGTAAWAQDGSYPTRPVTLVVSAAAGGTTDLAARMISEPLSRALGQPVVVDNRPGGSGGIAAQTVARAKPDGYTLMVQYSGYQVISPLLMKNAWDPVKDFSPVANILSAPQVLVVRPSLPVKTLKELVAYAKANPNKLNYASSGNGSLQHVSTELLNQMAGIQITHVPYKGTGPAMTDLLGGSVDLTITTPPPLMGHIPSWFALYAPAGTPKPIIDKLAGEIDRIMQTEAFRKKAEELGAEAKFMGPQQLAAYQRSELARWAKVIKAADIHAE